MSVIPKAAAGEPNSLQATVRDGIQQVSSGRLDAILEHYAEDVVLITPIYPLGKPVGEPEVRGKAAVKAHLLQRLAHYEGLTISDVFPNERGYLVTMRSASGEGISASIELNDMGHAQRVYVFHT